MPSGATARIDPARVAAARRWFRVQGHRPIVEDGVTTVATPAHPTTWEGNFAMAGPGVGAAAVLAALGRLGRWQVVHVDVLTEPEVEAALALAGFAAAETLIEMVAEDPVAAPLPVPAFDLVPVGPANWPTLVALIEADQRERRHPPDPAVTAGLIETRRGRLRSCDYRLIVERGEPVGYGMTAVCPGGLGLIENLFTLPARRGRGLMSGFIVAAAARLRAAGCEAVFLDADAGDVPKLLYARLGFRAASVARTWVRRVG